MKIDKLSNKEKLDYFVKMHFRYAHKLTIDKKDNDLIARIKQFKKECRKINFPEEYGMLKENDHGISLLFCWEEEIGFVYTIHTTGAHCSLIADDSRKILDDYLDELKKQADVIRKAKKTLAKLIRLKNKLKLPGPVSQGNYAHEIEGGSYIWFHELTQEEINRILKY